MSNADHKAPTRTKALGLGLAAGVSAGLMLGLGPASHAAIVYTGCAGTSSCTLPELFAGGSIQIDDLLFDNFKLGAQFGLVLSDVSLAAIGQGTTTPGLQMTTPATAWQSLHYTFDLSSLSPTTTVTGQTTSLLNFVSANNDRIAFLDSGVGNSVATASAPVASVIFGTPLSGTGLLASANAAFHAPTLVAGDQLTLSSYGFTLESAPPSDIPAPLPLALISIGVATLAGMRLWRKG